MGFQFKRKKEEENKKRVRYLDEVYNFLKYRLSFFDPMGILDNEILYGFICDR